VATLPAEKPEHWIRPLGPEKERLGEVGAGLQEKHRHVGMSGANLEAHQRYIVPKDFLALPYLGLLNYPFQRLLQRLPMNVLTGRLQAHPIPQFSTR